MKQIIILLALFLIFSNTSFSQENEIIESNSSTINKSSLHRFEFGVNTTSLIRNNIFDQKEIESYPYDFMLNFIVSDNTSFRTAFKVINNRTDNGADRITNNNDIGFRFGASHNKKLTEKIFVYYGFDMLFELNNRKTKVGSGSNPFKSGSDRKLFGFGPILGFQYQISKHISVRIESELYFKYAIINTTNSNQSADKSKSKKY